MKTAKRSSYLTSWVAGLCILHHLMILAPMVKSATAPSTVPDFYYYYGEKIPLKLSTEMITVCFQDAVSAEKKKTLIADDPILGN